MDGTLLVVVLVIVAVIVLAALFVWWRTRQRTGRILAAQPGRDGRARSGRRSRT